MPAKVVRHPRIAIDKKTCRCWGKYKQHDPECEICRASLECECEQIEVKKV